MTAFRYEAARADGATVRGVLDAASGPDAAAVLSARGLFPIAVEAAPERRPGLFGRPPARALATAFRGLASLVEAGVPLEHALRTAERVTAGSLRHAWTRVGDRVRQGSSLASALGGEQGVFSLVTIGLVRAGELGVGLAHALDQAAAELEARAEMAGRIRAALAYPMLLAVVGTLSVALIVLVIVPRFAALLSDLGQALPTATRLLLALSDGLRRYGLVLGAALLAGAVAGVQLVSEQRAAWHAWLLGLPLIGPVRHAVATARAGRTLGVLLGTGTPALVALDIARQAVGDEAVARRLASARDRVAEGAGLAAALNGTAALSPTALELAAIGEGSGRLPDLLIRAAALEAQEAERRLKLLVTLLEPGLILAFAGVVAFVAAALLQAVYSLRP